MAGNVGLKRGTVGYRYCMRKSKETKGKLKSKERLVDEERQRKSRDVRWSRQREEMNKREDKGKE